jgi:hypothetical protein
VKIGFESSISSSGLIFSLTEVIVEVEMIKPVRVLFPKGATARTPGFARSSSDFGTEYVKEFLNGRGKTNSAYI